MKVTSDEIRLLKLKDEETFEKIYYAYKDLVYFVVFDILRTEQDTDEVVQDTFLKMINEIDKFDGRYFRAWLLTIARNLAINRYKQNKRNSYIIDEKVYQTEDNTQNYRDLLMEIEEILAEDEYQIVILANVYHLKYREIAKYLNRPLGTICWQYNEAIKKLKKALMKGKN